jgi:glycosyltransferase
VKFSIITIVYNNLEQLKGCISSLHSQKDVIYEHVIQDALSKDGTASYIQSLNNSNINLLSEKDRGIYDALNRGMKRSSGDIIGLIHSDDLYASDDVLKRVHAEFEKGFDVVYGDLEYVSRQNTSEVFREWISGDFDKDKLKYGWMPPHPTFFFKREILKRVGNYNSSYEISADYDFMLRILMLPKVKVSYIPMRMIKMRVGGASNRSIHNVILKMKEDFRTMKKYFTFPLFTLFFKNFRKLNQIKLSYFKKS